MLRIPLVIIFSLFLGLSMGQTGPGGVGSVASNGLWLRADNLSLNNNDPVVTWNDASGNTNNATAAATEQPLFISSSAFNNMPAIRFDGNNDIMTVADAAILDGSTGLTYFAVLRPNNLDNSPRPIMGKRLAYTSTDYAYTWFFFSNNYLNLDLNTSNNRFDTNPTAFSNATNYLLSFNYDGSLTPSQRSKIYTSGTLNSTSTESSSTILNSSADLIIGTLNASDPRQLGADYAELIQFNFSLNTSQTILVNNYLSAKYNIALTSNDLYDEDDNGDYDYDVTGIGRTSATDLNNDGQGSGMVRILNPSDLDDDEFLIWGHDNGLAQAQESTDVPTSVASRFVRVWRASEVNTSVSAIDVGDLDIRFDLSNLGVINALDLRLLIDVDNDGVFADETPIAGATNVGGNVYQFAGVDGDSLSNNRRFTIATIDKIETPLPIELLSFTANINEDKVDLKWITITEVNNKFFTIERSANGSVWEDVAMVAGERNSSSYIEYMDVDYNPYEGVSYYRLKQTDFDGKYTYSNVVPVNFVAKGNGSINLFPNPVQAGESINISFDDVSGTEVLVVLQDIVGKEYYTKLIVNVNEGELIALSIDSEIPAGIYLITASSNNSMYSQKLIVR